MQFWDIGETDSHFDKFITEMLTMPSAKYSIGVSTTNVSSWIYFIRPPIPKDDTFIFLTIQKQSGDEIYPESK